MESEEFNKDSNKIQSILRSPYAAKDWKELKEKIQLFMKATKRTWSGAIFILLERGISEYERNGSNLE
jgi:hypothetical protein